MTEPTPIRRALLSVSDKTGLTDLGKAMRQPLQGAMNAVNAEIAEAMGADAPQLWSLLRRLGDLDLDREVQQKNV